jgi:hypothetical protein
MRLSFFAFRDSYTTRWEIKFIFTAFSCPVVGPVRRADWRQPRLDKNGEQTSGLACLAESRVSAPWSETRNFAPRNGRGERGSYDLLKGL